MTNYPQINKTPNINSLENSIFRNDSEFNCFKDIDEETKERIFILAQNFINTNFKDKKEENYKEVLMFLNSNKGRFTSNPNGKKLLFKTYDEVILFYIFCCDPNLMAYKNFIFLDNKVMKDKTIKDLGFYNEKIAKYEKSLFLDREKILVTGVKNKNRSYLTLLMCMSYSFEKTSQERFNEIKLLAEEWLKFQIEGTELQTCSYILANQSNLLNLKNTEEQVLFFINAFDPKLKALSIYEEESRMQIIQKRIMDELGFYYDNLIKLEKLFLKNYMPDLEMNTWTKKKML